MYRARYSAQVLMKHEFSRHTLKKMSNSSVIKIHGVVIELYLVDGWTGGQTDMTKLVVAFRSFANVSKYDMHHRAISKTETCVIPLKYTFSPTLFSTPF
jgi:hypothetical protein